MNRRWRRWIPTVILWALFLVSLGLARRYSWLSMAWSAALMLFVLGVSVYSAVRIFRHRHETTSISYQSLPRWLERFFLDEEEPDEPNTTLKVDSK
jgi:hypothetical protein